MPRRALDGDSQHLVWHLEIHTESHELCTSPHFGPVAIPGRSARPICKLDILSQDTRFQVHQQNRLLSRDDLLFWLAERLQVHSVDPTDLLFGLVGTRQKESTDALEGPALEKIGETKK